jgi:hypothetical protein
VKTSIVGLEGDLADVRFAIGEAPVTFGREEDNDVVITDPLASRWHAELQQEADGYVLADRHSSNGTWVNGAAITTHHLRSGDEIIIGDQKFRFEVSDPRATIQRRSPGSPAEPLDPESVLRVIVSGGGPVGLTFALLLADLMGPRVAIRIHNGRWKRDGDQVVWKGPEERNDRDADRDASMSTGSSPKRNRGSRPSPAGRPACLVKPTPPLARSSHTS